MDIETREARGVSALRESVSRLVQTMGVHGARETLRELIDGLEKLTSELETESHAMIRYVHLRGHEDRLRSAAVAALDELVGGSVHSAPIAQRVFPADSHQEHGDADELERRSAFIAAFDAADWTAVIDNLVDDPELQWRVDEV